MDFLRGMGSSGQCSEGLVGGVMLENYTNLLSLGKDIVLLKLIIRVPYSVVCCI